MSKPTLYYVYDALCGWCYGFSPVMLQLHTERHDALDFVVVSGGMMTGERRGPIGQVAPYIKSAYRSVEDRTGVRFGEKFLQNILEPGTAILDSRPPAVALAILREHQPERAVEMAHALQQAIYFDGIEPAVAEQYGPYAEAFGVAGDVFLARMQDPVYQRLADTDFQLSQAFGVSGFPTVLLQRGESYYLLARGYTDLTTLNERLNEALALA